MAETEASTRKLQALEREIEAIRLKAAGLTYEQIAQRLGYNDRSAARKAVMRALADRVDKRDDEADELRQLELERLDRLIAGVSPGALGGVRKVAYTDTEILETPEGPTERTVEKVADVYVAPDGELARVLLKASHQRSNLLGLYPPRRTEMSGPGGGPIPLDLTAPTAKEQLLQKVDELAEKRKERQATGAKPKTQAAGKARG